MRFLVRFAPMLAALLVFPSGGSVCAEPVVLVQPLFDQSDRIAESFERARPPPAVQRIGLGRGKIKQGESAWRRHWDESVALRLDDAKLIVLENAHAEALHDVEVASGGALDERLPPWVRGGGWLVVVGGSPGFDTYPGTPLEALLPIRLIRDDGARAFRREKRRPVEGRGIADLYINHLHPVKGVEGEVRLKAGGKPLVVAWPFGKGRVLAVLSGIHESHLPDGVGDVRHFFSSERWSRLLLDVASSALGETLLLGPALHMPAPPAVRSGASVRASYWFEGPGPGRFSLVAPEVGTVFQREIADNERFRLPELRVGLYEARFDGVEGPRVSTPLRVGAPVDLESFDIRYFAFGHRPPQGMAPGEASLRARELREAGVTSAYFNARKARPRSDMRALREVAGEGLELFYYNSLRGRSYYPKWQGEGPAPFATTDLKGKEIGWDIHDERFRARADHFLDSWEEVSTLPGLRGVQLFEEQRDGNMRSPSLQGEMRAAGVRGDEKPGDQGWIQHEDIRSRATGETYRRLRDAARRWLPGGLVTTYWPGSYWSRPHAYTLRPHELASAADQLLPPAYGFTGNDSTWLSAIDGAAMAYAAQGHREGPTFRRVLYTLGRSLAPAGGDWEGLDLSAWRQTAWTGLAHGTHGIAYFRLPTGEKLAGLDALHEELARIGPWIRAAERRPARVAVLASWSTRGGGDERLMKRHDKCLHGMFRHLAAGYEEVDYVLEHGLASPPVELRAIVLTAAVVLPDETVAAIIRFAEKGGHVFAGKEAGTRDWRGPRQDDRWARARATGRFHVLGFAERCDRRFRVIRGALPSIADRLRELDIHPRSEAPGRRQEARLLGDGEVIVWMLVNHAIEPSRVRATGRFDPTPLQWVDLRRGGSVTLPPHAPAAIAREVSGRDAEVLMGVRRPAATLAIEARASVARIEVLVRATDADGKPVADGHPLALEVFDAAGTPQLAASRRSRVTRDGIGRWMLPIPLMAASGTWRLQASSPFLPTGTTASIEVGSLRAASEVPVR